MSPRRVWSLMPRTCLLAVFVLAFSHRLPAQKQEAPEKPSLDRLVQRVNEYWDLLARGKKLQALAFVEEADRESFVALQLPALKNPRIVSLEPTAGGQEATVTVEVERFLPPVTAPFKWPVKERWLFQSGEWFVVIPKAGFALIKPAERAKPGSLSPEEIEQQKKTILERLRFDRTEVDFGVVRKGRSGAQTLQYGLRGDEAFSVESVKAPRGLSIHGLETRKLTPDGPHNVELEFMAADYDHGVVQEEFVITVRYGGASVPYRFNMKAGVYAPVSAAPSVLRFAANETEKEVVISNNSRSEVRIVSTFNQSGGISVTPLPCTIASGETARLQVRLRKSFAKNHRENLILRFQAPVEDMRSLPLRIAVNPSADERREGPKGPAGLTPAQIEELSRKAKPPR